MSETEAVREARAWRREVHEQTRNLTVPQRRVREDELLRAARAAGVEFEDVLDADAEATPMRTRAATGDSTSGSVAGNG